MVGLDRAEIWFETTAEAALISAGIQKKYSKVILNTRRLKNDMNYSYRIEKDNINSIKIIDKGWNRRVGIDFSYPRGITETNLYPLADEIQKVLIEEKLVLLLKEITLEEVYRENLEYGFLEFCTQENIKGFFKYNNLINLFYKALIREFECSEQVQFNSYDRITDRFYQTGFSFSGEKGWRIRLYSKLHEYNKKVTEKEKGALLKLEHRLTAKKLKNIFGTNKIKELPLERMKKEISKTLGKRMLILLEKETLRCSEVLDKHFKDFKARDLKLLVKDLQEWIIDEKIVSYIVGKNSDKSIRQIERYRATIKETLKESQNKSSPKRENFGNIARLEFFIKNILLVKCEVKCKYNEELNFIYI